MRPSRSAISVLASALLTITSFASAVPASAALPTNLGDFTFTLDQPVLAVPATATGFECKIGGSWVAAGSNMTTLITKVIAQGGASCQSTNSIPFVAQSLTGTVDNKTLALSGPMNLTCDGLISGTARFDIAISGMTPSSKNFTLEFAGTQSCTWSMTLKDAQSAVSVLSGTADVDVKSIGTMRSDGKSIDVTLSITGQPVITAGTGVFAGMTGTADFTESFTQNVPVAYPAGASGGSTGGGGGTGGGDTVPCDPLKGTCKTYCAQPANATSDFCVAYAAFLGNKVVGKTPCVPNGTGTDGCKTYCAQTANVASPFCKYLAMLSAISGGGSGGGGTDSLQCDPKTDSCKTYCAQTTNASTALCQAYLSVTGSASAKCSMDPTAANSCMTFCATGSNGTGDLCKYIGILSSILGIGGGSGGGTGITLPCDPKSSDCKNYCGQTSNVATTFCKAFLTVTAGATPFCSNDASALNSCKNYCAQTANASGEFCGFFGILSSIYGSGGSGGGTTELTLPCDPKTDSCKVYCAKSTNTSTEFCQAFFAVTTNTSTKCSMDPNAANSCMTYCSTGSNGSGDLCKYLSVLTAVLGGGGGTGGGSTGGITIPCDPKSGDCKTYCAQTANTTTDFCVAFAAMLGNKVVGKTPCVPNGTGSDGCAPYCMQSANATSGFCVYYVVLAGISGGGSGGGTTELTLPCDPKTDSCKVYCAKSTNTSTEFCQAFLALTSNSSTKCSMDPNSANSCMTYCSTGSNGSGDLCKYLGVLASIIGTGTSTGGGTTGGITLPCIIGETCKTYCTSNPKSDICQGTLNGAGLGTLPCSTNADCKVYCSTNTASDFCKFFYTGKITMQSSMQPGRGNLPAATTTTTKATGKFSSVKLAKTPGKIAFATPSKPKAGGLTANDPKSMRFFGKVGASEQKIVLATRPAAQCMLYAKNGTAAEVPLLTVRGKAGATGVLSTSLRAVDVAAKLKLGTTYAGKSIVLRAACNIGTAGADVSVSQIVRFADTK